MSILFYDGYTISKLVRNLKLLLTDIYYTIWNFIVKFTLKKNTYK
jgi:hypothetical protein